MPIVELYGRDGDHPLETPLRGYFRLDTGFGHADIRRVTVRFNIAEAAKILGIPRKRILELLEDHDLDHHRRTRQVLVGSKRKLLRPPAGANEKPPTKTGKYVQQTMIPAESLERIGKLAGKETVVQQAIQEALAQYWRSRSR